MTHSLSGIQKKSPSEEESIIHLSVNALFGWVRDQEVNSVHRHFEKLAPHLRGILEFPGRWVIESESFTDVPFIGQLAPRSSSCYKQLADQELFDYFVKVLNRFRTLLVPRVDVPRKIILLIN